MNTLEKLFIEYSYSEFVKKGLNHQDYLNCINLNVTINNFYPKTNEHVNTSSILDYYNYIKSNINNEEENSKNSDIILWGDNYFKINTLNAYSQLFKYFIVDKIDNFENSIGFDFGSGLGFSTINYSLYNPLKIYATDYRDKNIVNYFVNNFKSYSNNTTEIQYIQNNSNNRLFQTNLNNLDWVVVYDVLQCIPREKDGLYHKLLCDNLKFIHKTLKKNGILFICEWEQSDINYKQTKEKLNFHAHSVKKYNDNIDSGRVSHTNFKHLCLQSEICKILEIIGFKNIELYHCGFKTDSRYYISCRKS